MAIKSKIAIPVCTSQVYMRRFFSFVVLCLVSWFIGSDFLPASANADEYDDVATFTQSIETQSDYQPEEVLVTLADENDTGIDKIEGLIGGTVKQRIVFPDNPQKRHQRNQGHSDKKQVLRIKLTKGKSVEQTIAENWSGKDPRIISVEPDYKVRISTIPNDPSFRYMWALRNTGQTGGTANADIDAVSAWNVTTGSDDVVVAVIDTGIDYTHPDLADNMWTNPGEIAGNNIDDDNNGFIDDVHGYDFASNDGDPMDEHSHGSHVAGTIAASGNNGVGVTGINWHCKVMACRFLDASGSGSVSNAIKAINYAVANGAKILNNSWGGGGYSSALAAAITNARDNGVLFVAAAGNDGTNNDSSPHYPSGYTIENVISVAATSHTDALASFSNYGQNTVHVAAPGVSIISTVLDGEYAWYSGTSMATPHVSGVAALLLAHDPTMNIYELKARLIWTGDPIDSLAGKTLTERRLNAYNALTATPALSVITPNNQVTWVWGFDWPIQWMSIGGSDTVNIYLLKAGETYTQLAQNIPNTGSFSWHIPDTIPVGSDYRIWIDDGVRNDQSDANFTISSIPIDYFTRQFSNGTGRFNLSNKSLLLTPDDNYPEKYTACLNEITELPTDLAGSTSLNLGDDDSMAISLTGQSVKLYGTSYTSFYVGSNGFITFDSADISFSESTTAHFSQKRISGLFRDLDPSSSGSVETKTLDDREVITWNNVPEYGSSNPNTFQIEMFYNGQIRLSWLSIAAQYGIAGISEGLGQPTDFEQSDLAGYGQCRGRVDSIEVTGPDAVEELSTAQFTCIAHYEDGSTEDITSNDTNWGADSNYAIIDNAGLLTTEDVDIYTQCTVTATYNGKSASHPVIINDGNTHNITIQKSTVRAGPRTNQPNFIKDSIVCSGAFGIASEILDEANNITVQIYSSADDYLVYEQTIPMGSFTKNRNIYRYKYTVRSGQSGAITSLWFDVNKGKFYLKAKNVDLTGLRCPFYVLINAGGFAGLGVAGEDVVNGRGKIPILLLSGYADTLSVSKAKPMTSSLLFNDRLSVRGTFTVEDGSTLSDGLTITWGSQTFTIPGEQFSLIGTSRFKCKYTTPEGAIINADFNFANCKFSVSISHTSITQSSGTVDFGLAFGDYNQNVEAHL